MAPHGDWGSVSQGAASDARAHGAHVCTPKAYTVPRLPLAVHPLTVLGNVALSYGIFQITPAAKSSGRAAARYHNKMLGGRARRRSARKSASSGAARGVPSRQRRGLNLSLKDSVKTTNYLTLLSLFEQSSRPLLTTPSTPAGASAPPASMLLFTLLPR